MLKLVAGNLDEPYLVSVWTVLVLGGNFLHVQFLRCNLEVNRESRPVLLQLNLNRTVRYTRLDEGAISIASIICVEPAQQYAFVKSSRQPLPINDGHSTTSPNLNLLIDPDSRLRCVVEPQAEMTV
jgi:hypothetical protein